MPIRMQRVCKRCIVLIENERLLLPTVNTKSRLMRKQTSRLESSSSPMAASGESTTEASRPLSISISNNTTPATDVAAQEQSPKKSYVHRGHLEYSKSNGLFQPLLKAQWKRGFVICLLRKGTIGLYDRENDTTPLLVIQLTRNCRVHVIHGNTKRPHQFQIKSDADDKLKWTFSAMHLKDMNEWIHAFAYAIQTITGTDKQFKQSQQS